MNRSTGASWAGLARSALTRSLLLAVLWWALTEGNLRGWYYGVLVIAVATPSSLMLVPPGSWRWKLLELPRFGLFFLRQSVLGGADVARRAFDPRLPVDPAFVEYPLRLQTEPARVFFLNTMSLLPGTVSVELRPDCLRIHVLDRNMPVQETLRELEDRVARLFDLDLPRPDTNDRSGG
jgi:multicomponent Na+:H+ antiporter subunit E